MSRIFAFVYTQERIIETSGPASVETIFAVSLVCVKRISVMQKVACTWFACNVNTWLKIVTQTACVLQYDTSEVTKYLELAAEDISSIVFVCHNTFTLFFFFFFKWEFEREIQLTSHKPHVFSDRRQKSFFKTSRTDFLTHFALE